MSIANRKEISITLKLAKLSPFIEENGTIWVKERLKLSNLDYSTKHSITTSVGESTSRQPTWVHRIRKKHAPTSVLDHRIKRCSKENKVQMYQMQIQKRQPIHPPSDRPTREHVLTFTHTGVNYFGPLEVKFLRRTLKRCCCLFNCLIVRAVTHQSYTVIGHRVMSNCCVRFIARRGYPNTIISDNGINFVGEANEMKAFMKVEQRLRVTYVRKRSFGNSIHLELHKLLESGRDWFKVARKLWLQSRTTQASPRRYSVLQSVFQSKHSARPLTAVSDDPEDLTALTPNHFLLVRENASAPFMPFSERNHVQKNPSNRFKHMLTWSGKDGLANTEYKLGWKIEIATSLAMTVLWD